MAEEVKKHGRQKVIVPIDSVPYTVDAFLSINDFEQLVDADEENAKLAVAEFIQKRIVDTGLPTPTVETIAEQEDICFQELINALLDDDQTLKECYAKRDESEPLCTRFVLAAKETADIWAKNLAEAFKKIVIPKIPKITIPTSVIESISKQLSQITDTLSSIASSIYETWKPISIPTISEEKKEEIAQAQIQWGKYGWTQPPASPVRLFYTAPTGIQEAAKEAGEFCRSADMERLFSKLSKMKHVRKTDLKEAIFDYKNRQYKSCAFILFGLIDARLIRLQRDEDRNKRNGRRSSGASAAKNLFQRIESKHGISKTLFLMFQFQNVSSCLQKVFEDGNDFKTQPNVINRNFLDHGMLHRRVTKRDCIQLFLLYYNLLELLAIISPTKEA